MDGQPNFHPSKINGTAMGWTENGTHLARILGSRHLMYWIRTCILSSLMTNKGAALDARQDTKMAKDSFASNSYAM